MAPEAEAVVDAYPVKKRRTDDDIVEEDEGKRFLVPSDDDEVEEVPLTEEEERQISDYIQSFRMSGGFDIPSLPPRLLGYVSAPINHSNGPVGPLMKEEVTRAIKQHEMDLVLMEILSGGVEPRGSLDTFVTFKAMDSSGAIRTYETLLSPIVRVGDISLEIFRVKPYTAVETI